MSDLVIEDVEPLKPLSDLLMQLPPNTQSTQSSYWTPAEEGAAIKLSILRHIKAGWTWNPPYLEKGNASVRPSAVMRCKTPADRDFNPSKDALALRMGAHFIHQGKWQGYYEFGNLLMRHDGSLVDPEVCPECGGYPWFVRLAPDPFDRRAVPPQRVTACRRCVSVEELADADGRRRAIEEQAQAIKARREARRR